jgi:hypothetical protein
MSKKNGDGKGGDGTGGDDYEIGYRKPPTHTRWKKGQSGNKRGRPKKKLGISDIERAFDEALGDLLAVNDNGTVRKIKKLKALAIQTVNKAVKGHHQSANLLMAHYARRVAGGPEEPGPGSTAEEFEAEMEADLREIAARSQPAVLPNCEAKNADEGEDDPGASDDPSPDTKH